MFAIHSLNFEVWHNIRVFESHVKYEKSLDNSEGGEKAYEKRP